MRRREFIGYCSNVAAVGLLSPFAARAQHKPLAEHADKAVHIGWLTRERAQSLTPFLEAFRDGLAEFGYRENDNMQIDYRYGNDDLLRVAPLAAELARIPVDLLVVQGAD